MVTLVPVRLPLMTANVVPPGSTPLPLSEPPLSVMTKSCSAAPPAPQQSQVPVMPPAALAGAEELTARIVSRAVRANAAQKRRP